MFMNQTNLIIVCNEKMMDYANFLIQLVGQNDDTDEVRGVKDNSLIAAIWTEKQYNDSRATITSDTHILFIGNSKLAQSQAQNVKMYFEKYGMCYGWLGKRAVMYVDSEMLTAEQYSKFLSFAQEYDRKFKQEVTLTWENYFPLITVNSKNDSKSPFTDLLSAAATLASTISASFKKGKIEKQQYQCLTMVLYLEGLQKFLEA